MNGTRPSCDASEDHTPKCVEQCEKGYKIVYKKDRHFGTKAYSITEDVQQIQKEIMTNGPVEAAFTVYQDLLQYKSGIVITQVIRNKIMKVIIHTYNIDIIL